MDHSSEQEQPDNAYLPQHHQPPGLPAQGIAAGTSSAPGNPPPPPRPPGQIAAAAAASTAIVPETHWLPRGGISGTVLAVRDLLESYGWITWWSEMRKAFAARDVSDLAGPLAVFGMRLKQRTTNTVARDLMILVLILAAPFVVEAAALTMLEIVKSTHEIDLQRNILERGSKPKRSQSYTAGPDYGPQHAQLLSMVNLARPVYSAVPFLLALAVLALHTWRNCSVPFPEHSYELNRMTRMQSLNMIYSCWGYYLANMIPGLSLLLPAVLARSAMWNTSLKSELAILCIFSGVLLLGSGKPITVIPDASAKDDSGKPRKTANSGCSPGVVIFLFFFLGMPMLGPAILLLSYVTRLPLIPLIAGAFFVLPWIVLYRLLNAAEPLRYITENYTLPRRMITWGAMASGAVAGVACGWPGWITMAPGLVMVGIGYMGNAPKLLEDVAPASHFAPFQTHGRLWQLLGRLAYPGWQSTQMFTMASLCLYIVMGMLVDIINEQLGVSAWHLVGMHTGPSFIFILTATVILWNALMYPLVIMRVIMPGSGIYGMAIVTVHFVTLVAFLIVTIAVALFSGNLSPDDVPAVIHMFPLPGAIAWAITGIPPQPTYLALCTAVLTLLAGLQIYRNMDWMCRKENEGRKLRGTRGSSMLA